MNTTETAKFTVRTACISCGGTGLVELSAGRFDEGAVQRFIEEDPWGEHPAPFLREQQWSFVACKDCGLMFHRYILDPEWNERRFSKWMSQDAIEAFEKHSKTPANVFRKAAGYTAHVLQIEQLTRSLRGSEVPRVLDFGCGYGGFLSMCSMYGFEAYGVDRSAAKRDNNSFSKVFAEIEDIANMSPFHALTLFEVLEHLDDPHGLMLRLSELLATGGILVLETPDCSGVRTIGTRDDYGKIHPLEHINAFTPETLKRFATRLGFAPIRKPVSCVTCDSMKFVKTVAKRLLGPVMLPTTQLYFRRL
ncbi:type 12 methyltransferase [Pseudomonas fluorescens HK44]|uniref:Type 12 methyltransferase n=1 Tax=Pseudomonas fluorescens HK44 TaxID=1042209 RepID=A0A010SGA0_PSEFL|nr:class I SAM-dependent methyltransferase [Pseudomonas fluorescens]EXF92170.1 type 12 methyltransferase [Pseudomonas fluorescens HK44]